MNLKQKFDSVRVTDYDLIGIDPPCKFWIRNYGAQISAALGPVMKAFGEMGEVLAKAWVEETKSFIRDIEWLRRNDGDGL